MTTAPEDDEPLDWTAMVKAMDAVTMLAPKFGSLIGAKAELADLMRDGLLEVWARKAWDSRKRDITDAWLETPDQSDPRYDIQTEFVVSPRAWRFSKQWLTDISEWRWPSGRFSTVQRRSPFMRYMFDGVYFLRAEIEALRDGTLSNGVNGEPEDCAALDDQDGGKVRSKKPRGPRPRNKAWGAVMLEVVRLREAGELTKARFKEKKYLTSHLVEKSKHPAGTAENGDIEPGQLLGEDTIESVVTVVYDALIFPADGAPTDAD